MKHSATAILAIWFAASALWAVDQPGIVRESCDLVEVNHFFDEQGRLVFDQVIWWDWSADECRYQVRAWRLVKSPSQLPQRSASGYDVTWMDGELLRRVEAKQVRETWTQFDPEIAEREVLPKERRKELVTPVVRRKL